MSDIPGWGVKLQTEVAQLQTAVADHIEKNRDDHRDLYQRTERPSWLVAWVLTVMGSLVGGLTIWAVTHVPR